MIFPIDARRLRMQRSLLRFYLSKANLEAVGGERVKTLTECASKHVDLHLELVALLAHECSVQAPTPRGKASAGDGEQRTMMKFVQLKG
ncbi:hypothetical protein DXU07_28830 [Bradyrhizobium elkanii]|jgi:hypothetical protein|nr:hypothetical protein [Bradyrhizobium elkanii]NWL69098.1 hypothetical protein [Bradyrhizobium elkanii]RYM15803.1 hypothetical protein EWH13_38890 [Bradyrhizobium elkanii]